jgi:molybdopterin molybdotransferase
MTGAVVPIKANTVVMYEHIEINEGIAKILKPITKGQNVHFRGSDEPKGTVLLEMGTRISPAEIGVLATVGKTEVSVKRNPRITLFSTGDELVSVHQTPKAHQIRQSNSHTLRAALFEDGIASEMVHVQDEKASIKATLLKALNTSDALLLSGGVSKGKYDYLPEVLDEVGVKKYFHRVMQRPGKPFWFGHHEQSNTTIFGFPGNPTSTFANFHVYFKPWLNVCMGQAIQKNQVILNDSFENITDLTRFVRARVDLLDGQMLASLVQGNGSGDLTSLTIANGFVQFKPNQKLTEGEKVPFISTRRIL